MNPIFSRTLKALCTVSLVALLSACGASSTVEPFKPTRVVGLGDGFNDSARGIAPTVADQVASNFGLGLSSVVNVGSATGRIANLSTQIGQVTGGFNAGDLVVISVGTIDVQNAASPTASNQVPELVRQIQWLLNHDVKHILLMPILDVSKTPWGVANLMSADTTAAFNTEILNKVRDNFGGRSPNPVIYADSYLSPISSQFRSMTASTPLWLSPFNCFKLSSCTNATADTSLFDTSDTYLTPAGNRWVAGNLYNATSQGWR